MTSSPVFTLACATAVGVLLMVLAVRLRLPSIVLLLLGGIGLGPEGLGVIDPSTLGGGLQLVVGFSVAVVLFEGGLTLDIAGARRYPVVIRRLLSSGVLITWLGAAIALYLLFELDFPLALLCGSLVIVTGPTVISPLLRRIGVRDRIKHVLYWEAVLVDAVGVFIAVLCFEWLFPASDHYSWSPLVRFLARVALGVGAGVAFGLLTALALRSHLVHEEQASVFVLGAALGCYGFCEALLHESGILAVIVAALVINVAKPPQMAEIKRFKLELTELAIGTLFILLTAMLDLDPFVDYGWRLYAAVAVLLLVLRPLVIISSTFGRGFTLQEKLFLSWIAPRGIVAAFMASLFALQMSKDPTTAPYAQVLQTFTFAVIGITVLLQGFSAPWVARLLGLKADEKRTWLFVGPEPIAVAMAEACRAAEVPAIALVPSSPMEGDDSDETRDFLIYADPTDRELFDDPRLSNVGAVVAATKRPYYNQLVCQRWATRVGQHHCFRLADPEIDSESSEQNPAASGDDQPIWSHAGSPDELQQGLEAGHLALGRVTVTEGDGDRFGAHLLPLFQVDGPRLALLDEPVGLDGPNGPDGPDGPTDVAKPGSELLVLRRLVPGLAETLHDALVIDDPESTFDSVVQQILQHVAGSRTDIDVEALTASIVEREQSVASAMGSGVAIPHSYHEGVDRSSCYVASIPAGLDSKRGPDGEPVRLVFLVLSPEGRAEEHLKTLAMIARLTSDREYADMLLRQTSGEALLQRLRDRA